MKQAPQSRQEEPVLLTVGHSTRSIEEFQGLLSLHDVKLLVDVRTVPRSRHNAQFNSEELARSLKAAGIEYLHMPALGGLRHAHPDSINSGWRNASFRGYADYMQTSEFTHAVESLVQLARKCRTAIMCAEAVPWRCHRSLIADALVVRGIHVEEIISRTSVRRHSLTPWARPVGTRITYPDQSEQSRTGTTDSAP